MVEVRIDQVKIVIPPLYRGVEHGPWCFEVRSREVDACQSARRAVVAIAAHYPGSIDVTRFPLAFDRGHDATWSSPKTDEAGCAQDLAPVVFKEGGEDRFSVLFGETEVKAISAVRQAEVQLTERSRVRAQPSAADPHASIEQAFGQSERFEDLD